MKKSLIWFVAGWDDGVSRMARAMAQHGDLLVIGIDHEAYSRKLRQKNDKCLHVG